LLVAEEFLERLFRLRAALEEEQHAVERGGIWQWALVVLGEG
jgi:hypothetical protein